MDPMENPQFFSRKRQAAKPEDLQREEADETCGHPWHHLLNGNEKAWLVGMAGLLQI